MTDLDPDDWRLAPGLAARLLHAADEADDVLSDAERVRMATFQHADRRRQFALGRAAARSLAAARLGVAPEAVPLAVAEDGAPTLPSGHVSIAHTGRGGEVAAVAAVAPGPVGVDLERVAPRRPDLWRRILRDDERSVLDALGGPTDDVQTLLWTLKEAVLKGQRTGLRAGGRSVRLSLEAEGAPPSRGLAAATAGASGVWTVAYGRVGGLWVAVAWPAEAACHHGRAR